MILLAEMPGISPSRQHITTTYLVEVIQPYFVALADLQKVMDEIQGLQPREIVLNALSAMRPDLPIGLSLSGAHQAISLAEGFVTSWRAEYAADLRLFLTGRRQPALEAVPVEPAAWRAAEENLHAALPGLAQKVAEHLVTQLSAKDQPGLAQRLLRALSTLGISPLQLVADKPKVER